MVKFRGVYCNWIPPQRAKRNEEISDFQEYVRGKHPRYDRPIDGRGDNAGVEMKYDPIEMARNGYGPDEEVM